MPSGSGKGRSTGRCLHAQVWLLSVVDASGRIEAKHAGREGWQRWKAVHYDWHRCLRDNNGWGSRMARCALWDRRGFDEIYH
eukprot:9156867-Alexandrium_andersonii.AAC.1